MKNNSSKNKTPSFLSSVSWSFLDQMSLFVINLFISAVLARLIEPSEFGLLAMVTVITGFLEVFKTVGLNESLIQKKNLSSQDINTVFWFTLFITFLLTIFIFFSAPWIAKFYNNQRLEPITYAIGGLFFLNTLGSIPDALIRKDLLFKSFFLRNLLNRLIYGSIGISLAYAGYGIWSLIISQYVSVFFITWVSFKIIQWRPRFFFDKKILKPHLLFGLPLLTLKIFYYWSSNIDTLLIGKKLGEQTLGYYNKAYGLMTLPVNKISSSISRVIFPMFSQEKNNMKKIWEKYLKLLSISAFLIFPLMGAMFILAKEIILLVYGPNWMPSVMIFKKFAFIGAILGLTYTGTILKSVGETKKILYVNIPSKLITILAIIIGLHYKGINGVVLGFSIGITVELLWGFYLLSKTFNKKILDIISVIQKETLLNLILIFIVIKMIIYLKINDPILKIAFTLIMGGGMYAYFSYLLKLEGFMFLKSKYNYLKNKFKNNF